MQEFERIYIEFIHKVERLHASGELLIGLPLPPAAVSDEEKAVQEKLKEIAEGCIGLHADAMRRLVLKQRLRMYPVKLLDPAACFFLPFLATTHLSPLTACTCRLQIFWAVLLSFATVAAAAKEGRCSWGLAWAIADNLDALRRMVSRGCDAPLRLPWVMRVPVADAERHLPPAHFWGALIKVADATDPDCKFTAIDSCEASGPFFLVPLCVLSYLRDGGGCAWGKELMIHVLLARVLEQEAMLTLLGRLYTATKYDVDAMISVAPRA